LDNMGVNKFSAKVFFKSELPPLNFFALSPGYRVIVNKNVVLLLLLLLSYLYSKNTKDIGQGFRLGLKYEHMIQV